MEIKATIIADSVYLNKPDSRITTFELEYPRFIHSELMTHRLFSRNAASSRAIPVEKMIENIIANTAMPIHWGKNQPGMQAREECDALLDFHIGLINREKSWLLARDNAINVAKKFHEAGYHKQIVNRLLEPFTMMKTVVTSTEWANWYHLRDHDDADPVIHALAEKMHVAHLASTPTILRQGDWHTPYFRRGFWIDSGYVSPLRDDFATTDDKRGGFTLEEALMISSSCCAQVSYRKSDDSIEKAKIVFDRLVNSKPVHASPFEHQATPISVTNHPNLPKAWDEGITHVDRYGHLWSGNFKGWIQHRQLISGHTVW